MQKPSDGDLQTDFLFRKYVGQSKSYEHLVDGGLLSLANLNIVRIERFEMPYHRSSDQERFWRAFQVGTMTNHSFRVLRTALRLNARVSIRSIESEALEDSLLRFENCFKIMSIKAELQTICVYHRHQVRSCLESNK